MKQKLIITILILFLANSIFAQVLIFPIWPIGAAVMPEHGFLPGKKFTFYSTVDKYDLSKFNLRVELFDDRDKLKLDKVNCSTVEFTNTSEFAKPDCIYTVGKYIDTLLKQSGAAADSTSTDTLRVRLEGIEARLIGFGSITAHGLCQMKITYHEHVKTYCVDITDKDKHSPVSKNAFVTRKTGTRIIASAAIREVIEQFFADLKSWM